MYCVSLVDQLEPALDRLLDAPSARLLAPFALGGDGGVKPGIVARFLGLSAFELGEKLSRLAAAGLVRESQNGAVSVWPASARWTIVRGVFFGGLGSLPYSPLLKLAENAENVVHTLLGARSRGASIPGITDLLERIASEKLWAEFASLGAAEVKYALSKCVGASDLVAEACLDYAPESAIPRLLDSATKDQRLLHRTLDHALHRLETWAARVSPLEANVTGRRAALSAAAKLWWKQTGATDIAVRAMHIAMKPGFETTEADPGRGRTLTWSWGRLRDHELKTVAEHWPSVIEIVRGADEPPWNDLFDLVGDWLNPDPRLQTTDQTRALMGDVAGRMLQDLVTLSHRRSGVQSKLLEIAERAGISLDVEIDRVFEALYPREQIDGDDDHASWSAAVAQLIARWGNTDIDEIAATLSRVESEARTAGITYPRESPEVVRTLGGTATGLSGGRPTIYVSPPPR